MTNQTSRQPVIAVTMGDPAGVGPEICLQLLKDETIRRECIPVIIGTASILQRVSARLDGTFQVPVIPADSWRSQPGRIEGACVIDVDAQGMDQVQAGEISRFTGAAGFAYVELAIAAAQTGQVDAVATAPLNKKALQLAGVNYPGHTEIFAEKTGSKRWCMMQYSAAITCTFVTVHVGYADVPQLLTTHRVLEVIRLTAEGLQRLRKRRPKIVVCGLNPHAGEQGLFGNREEERIILPAIQVAQAEGIDVVGPLPPDTAFLPARRAETDAFVCMYHDQGHIPVKALAFDQAVNTTLGLPLVRTSVDHGTACDIAWQGKADASSLFAAVRLAIQMTADD